MHFYEFRVSSQITRNPKFGTRYLVKCVQPETQDLVFGEMCTKYTCKMLHIFLEIRNILTSFEFRLPSTECQVPSTVHRVPSTESRVSGDLRRDSELVKMHIILHLCCLNLRLEARKTGSSFEFRVSSLES